MDRWIDGYMDICIGTDSSVVLWNIMTVSSAPLGDLEDSNNTKEGDRCVRISRVGVKWVGWNFH